MKRLTRTLVVVAAAGCLFQSLGCLPGGFLQGLQAGLGNTTGGSLAEALGLGDLFGLLDTSGG